MDSFKISHEHALSCIRKFKSILHNRKRGGVYAGRQTDHNPGQSVYDLAKQQETKTRNLKTALNLYAKAALNGQKINSCIKDFASVLHQCGYTSDAINFLEDMKHVYKGDKSKYQKLISNLTAQLRPTGKHQYKNILIDLVDMRLKDSDKQILQMFSNHSRIKSIQFFRDLGFQFNDKTGRYVLLKFDSFSAAKKTLETFKQDQWFGINKYWMDSQFNIITQANNGKVDFQAGIVFSKGEIHKIHGKDFIGLDLYSKIPDFQKLYGFQGLQLRNQTNMYILKNFFQIFQIQNDSN